MAGHGGQTGQDATQPSAAFLNRRTRISSPDDELDETLQLQQRIASLHQSFATSAAKLNVSSILSSSSSSQLPSPKGKAFQSSSPNPAAALSHIESEISHLLSERDPLLREAQSARKQCALLSIQTKTLQTRVGAEKQRVADLEHQLEQLSVEQAKLDHILDKSRSRKADFTAAKAESEQLLIDKAALEQQLATQKKFHLRLESTLSSMSRAQASIAVLKKRSQEETEQLRAKLQREKDRVMAADGQVELLRAENMALHEAIEHLRATLTPRKAAREITAVPYSVAKARRPQQKLSLPSAAEAEEDDFYGDSYADDEDKSPERNQVGPEPIVIVQQNLDQELEAAAAAADAADASSPPPPATAPVDAPNQQVAQPPANQSLLSRPSTKRMLLNMILHIVFLCLMILVVLNTRDFAHGYFISSSLRTLLQDNAWETMQSHADVASWLRTTVLTNLYAMTDYNDNQFEDPQDSGYLLGRSKILGSIRLRQSRAKKVSCGLPAKNFPNMQDEGIMCIKPYFLFSEDTDPFGPPDNPSLFTFTNSDYIGGTLYLGTKATYGIGGYVVDIPSDNATAASAALNNALSNTYLDRQTSALFLEFATFTPAVQLFIVWRYAMEFPPEGGIIKYPSITVVNLFKYSADGDSLTMMIELLILGYVIKLSVENWRKWKRMRQKYFSNFFNLLDFTSLLIFSIVIGLRVRAILIASSMVIDVQPNYFMNLSSVAFFLEQETNAFAFCSMLCFLKLFYYFRLFPGLSMLSRTMTKAGKEVSGFLVIFFIILLGFSQTFYVSMGKYLDGYKDYTSSISSLFQMLLGDFNYESLASVNRVLAPLLFAAWNVLSVLVLLNMFVAIISEAFVRVQRDIRKATKEKSSIGEELVRIVSDRLNGLIGKLRSRKQAVASLRSAVAGSDADGSGHGGGIDADKFAELRKKLGAELSKYDTNKDGQLDEHEIEHMMSQLNAEEREIAKKERMLELELKERAASQPQDDDEEKFPQELRKRLEAMPSVIHHVARLEAAVRDVFLKEERIAESVAALATMSKSKPARKSRY